MKGSMLPRVVLAAAALAGSGCAATPSEERYSDFNAHLDALLAQVEERQQAAAALPDGPERDEELASLQDLARLLILARAGGALATVEADARALARIEGRVDAVLQGR